MAHGRGTVSNCGLSKVSLVAFLSYLITLGPVVAVLHVEHGGRHDLMVPFHGDAIVRYYPVLHEAHERSAPLLGAQVFLLAVVVLVTLRAFSKHGGARQFFAVGIIVLV